MWLNLFKLTKNLIMKWCADLYFRAQNLHILTCHAYRCVLYILLITFSRSGFLILDFKLRLNDITALFVSIPLYEHSPPPEISRETPNIRPNSYIKWLPIITGLTELH